MIKWQLLLLISDLKKKYIYDDIKITAKYKTACYVNFGN